ncbi:MAG: CotH kinase family protein [Phycisphaerales bacterium]
MRRMVCFGSLLAILLSCVSGRAYGQTARSMSITVVINEVLASNESIAYDPQGQFEDWIELYNVGQSPVDVGGCYLTDDLTRPTKWQIPTGDPAATTIGAGGYLLIWADGDIDDSGLHAAFKLDDEGEEVGLFAPDGLTMIDSLSFGPQYVDVSYGRYPDGGSELRFLTYPFAGAMNISIHEGIVEPVQFDVKTCVCTGPVTVTLTTATEGATIHYTLDGSEPYSEPRSQAVGAVYTKPLVVGGTVTLKAVALKSGWRRSEVTSERYIFLGADIRSFSSPLAIGVVDTFGKGISRSPVPAYVCFIDLAEGGRASMTGQTDSSGAATINTRGKSSEGFPKHQYHLEMYDAQGDETDMEILGLPAESDWVLQGPYSDKSLIRNVLSYRWANEMGRYAPRTRLIEMFLNIDNASVTMSDYVGVYVLMEKIKIGPNRVNVTELEPSDNVEPEVTGGYIIKKDKFDADDVSFGTSRGQSLIYQDPNGQDLTQQQRDWIHSYVNLFEAALYGASFTDPEIGYAKYIDVGSFIDNHILVELTKNIDGFRLSTYMHKDRNGKLAMGPAWDYNLSLGNADYLTGWLPTGWYFNQLGDGDYPYWRRLFADPAFELAYADRWFALRRDLFATDRLIGMVEDYATLLDEPAARNFNRWRILGQYVWPNWYVAATFRDEIAWMQVWLASRLAWMDGQIASDFAPAPPVFGQQGGHVESGFALTMSGTGTIYYTTDGTDPKLLVDAGALTSGLILAPENASKRVLVPSREIDDGWRGGEAFSDSGWTLVTGSPGGVGFERGTGYEDYITLDVASQMYNVQASCYVRIPFSFTGAVADLSKVTLHVRYDDGFIAYLNGVEIARRNFTGTPAWNSAAGGLHDDAAAVVFEEIDVAGFASVLRRGSNVLAIHAMNQSTTSSDFLISVQLTAEELAGQQSEVPMAVYAGPVPLTGSTRIVARSLYAGRWSALNDAVFAVGPVAENLRISEIMYHPADTGDPNDPNTEFIELTNIGAEALNLNKVRFIDGVEFTFPSFDLPPAGYCLVVKDLAAFENRYGPGLPVAGQYTGSLSNAGERVEIRDAADAMIQGFSYHDDWYDLTDGDGFSLTVVDPGAADPNALEEQDAWRPSTHFGGSPGAGD